MKDKTTTKLSNERLQPIVDFCQANKGATMRMLELYERAVGRPVDRSNFDRWLCRDPRRRTQPTFGSGLLLLEVWAEVMGKEWTESRMVEKGLRARADRLRAKLDTAFAEPPPVPRGAKPLPKRSYAARRRGFYRVEV